MVYTAYYNAGSAALVLVLIAVLIGGFLYWRSRKGGLKGLPLSNHGSTRLNENEESIPLRAHGDGEDHDGSPTLVGHDDEVRSRSGKGKGKERATTYEMTPKEEIFGVGDSDDEEKH